MRWARVSLVVVGTFAMGYAVLGTLTDPRARPLGQVLFLAAALLAHDLVVLPAALAVGALIGRVVPARARGVVRAATYASAVLALIALPLVIGAGRRADDPSALPLDYGRGLLVLLAAIWLAAAGALVVGRRRAAAPEPPA